MWYLSFRLRSGRGRLRSALAIAALILLSACSTRPLVPYSTESMPLILVPAVDAGVRDRRARFREVFCQVLEARRDLLPDYRPCAAALTRLADEPAGSGAPVDLGPSRRGLVAVMVPGVGWDCFERWLGEVDTGGAHLRRFGYDQVGLDVDGLSSSANNARQIRDAILRLSAPGVEPRLVLIGYSKGAPDILEALVAYPEIRERVAAVVSAAGSIGGSPLANNAQQSELELLRHWPGARCTAGDGGALDSLRPATRRAWLARHALPEDVPYYSLATLPEPGRISWVLGPSYRQLSRVDARNDGQVIFYDQLIPDSSLLGYLNADHWALAVPIGRSHPMLGATFVNHNDFPREALAEALLRFVEEDLAASDTAQAAPAD